jgi:ELWxxDGT repeat protein
MLLNSPFGPLRPRKSSKRTVRRRPSRKRTLGFGSTSASFQELESRCMLAATLIQDIWTGASSSNPSAMASLNGNVLFAANDGPTPGTQHGNELWRSDGTAAVLVMDINPGTHFNGVSNVANDSNPTDLTTSSSFVYFSADDGVHGVQLWRSDGSAAGTTMVTDINEAGGGFNATDLTDVNGVLYFTADDGTHGSQVWKTDGTSGGTIMISNLQPTTGGAALPASITNVNGTVFFTANAGTTGRELYITTGTLGSTHLLVNIYQGTGTANPQSLLNVNGTLYFTANDGVHGTELWKSDGTVPGTVMVSDIFAGVSGSNPTGLTNIGNTVFFAANDGTNGTQLWKSTGTAASTVMVKDINTTSAGASSNPNGLTNVDGILFFGANDGIHGQELWKSDGTTAGTVLVLDINPGAASSTPANLINGNGTLFFTANDGTHGVEPWQSDGTAAGTVILQDINPGLPSSNPQNLATADGFLFMAANNGTQRRDHVLGEPTRRRRQPHVGVFILRQLDRGSDEPDQRVLRGLLRPTGRSVRFDDVPQRDGRRRHFAASPARAALVERILPPRGRKRGLRLQSLQQSIEPHAGAQRSGVLEIAARLRHASDDGRLGVPDLDRVPAGRGPGFLSNLLAPRGRRRRRQFLAGPVAGRPDAATTGNRARLQRRVLQRVEAGGFCLPFLFIKNH